MSEVKEEVKKVEEPKAENIEAKIKDILKKELAPIVNELKEAVGSKTEETLEKVKLLEKTREVKDTFKALNGRPERFHEVIRLNDIDLTKPMEEVKKQLTAALDKYPEFRKTSEEGFTTKIAKVKEEDSLVGENGELDFLKISRKLGI